MAAGWSKLEPAGLKFTPSRALVDATCRATAPLGAFRRPQEASGASEAGCLGRWREAEGSPGLADWIWGEGWVGA